MFKKWKKLKERIKLYYSKKEKKSVAILYTILRIMVLLCLIRELFLGNYHNVFLCILTLILFLIPYFVDSKLKIEIPRVLEIIILLFIFSAEILGEIQNFYGIFPQWDVILHTLNGFLAAAIGFSLIDILNRSDLVHIKLTPIFVALVSFCFSMTVGVFWEFFEYAADRLTDADMQKDTIVDKVSSVEFDGAKSNVPVVITDINQTIIEYGDGKTEVVEGGYLDIGNIDTMEDLIVNFIGALTFSVLGFFYITNRDNYRFTEQFIVRRKHKKNENNSLS